MPAASEPPSSLPRSLGTVGPSASESFHTFQKHHYAQLVGAQVEVETAAAVSVVERLEAERVGVAAVMEAVEMAVVVMAEEAVTGQLVAAG